MLALLQQPQLVAETKTMSLSNAAKLTGADEEVQQLFTAAAALHSSLKNVPSTGVRSSLSRCRSCSCPGCSRQKTAVGAKIGLAAFAPAPLSSRHWYDWENLAAGCNTTSRCPNLPRHGLTQQTPAAGCDPARSCSEPAPVLQELHPETHPGSSPRRTRPDGRVSAAPSSVGLLDLQRSGGRTMHRTGGQEPRHRHMQPHPSGKQGPRFRLSSSSGTAPAAAI